MKIAIGNLVLASATPGTDYGPPADVEIERESMIQDSRTIGASLRRLYARGNKSGKLSFTTRPKYGSLEASAAGAARIAGLVDTQNTLTVTPSPEGTATPWTALNAVIRKVKARQIGVTVEAQYEIEW